MDALLRRNRAVPRPYRAPCSRSTSFFDLDDRTVGTHDLATTGTREAQKIAEEHTQCEEWPEPFAERAFSSPRRHIGAAQGLGSIAGVVRDTSGGVLPGVTVEAASPALIEKVRTAVTDSAGQYTIISLPLGTYSVTFTLPGFTTTRREGIEMLANFTASVNAEMRVGVLEETITRHRRSAGGRRAERDDHARGHAGSDPRGAERPHDVQPRRHVHGREHQRHGRRRGRPDRPQPGPAALRARRPSRRRTADARRHPGRAICRATPAGPGSRCPRCCGIRSTSCSRVRGATPPPSASRPTRSRSRAATRWRASSWSTAPFRRSRAAT